MGQGRVLVVVVVVGYLWLDVPCAMMGGCCAGTREVREVFALFLFLILLLRRVLMGWPPPPPRLVRLVTDLVKVEQVCLSCFVGSRSDAVVRRTGEVVRAFASALSVP